MSQLIFLTHNDIKNPENLTRFIYPNMRVNYYISDDFSPAFYIDLAVAGFISVSYNEAGVEYLLPEMQFSYSVLQFHQLRISKKVARLLADERRYRFSINESFDAVLEAIREYHQESWIDGKYLALLHAMKDYRSNNFALMTAEVRCRETGRLVAAEIGYRIYRTYTSLSGFMVKEKRYNHYGKLQMTLLAHYLESNGYSFWNLGHPYMQYKLDLGAKILDRQEFLSIWLNEMGRI